MQTSQPADVLAQKHIAHPNAVRQKHETPPYRSKPARGKPPLSDSPSAKSRDNSNPGRGGY